MSKRIVTIKPLNSFFFGGENTFGEGNQNYLVRSNYLPQQTAILGMLRHLILLNLGLIDSDPNCWNDFIGNKSFSIYEELKFGVISNLSPVFLKSKDNYYTTQSIDWSKEKGSLIAKPIVFRKVSENLVSFSNKRERNFVPDLKVGISPFEPKNELSYFWVNREGDKNYLFNYINDDKFKKNHHNKGYENGFFVEVNRIGITKNVSTYKEEAENTEKGFYKQYSYKFKDNQMSFAIFVDIPNDKLPNGEYCIHFGGENSLFKVCINDANNESFESVFCPKTFNLLNNRKEKAIIITGDTYCNSAVLEQCNYAITESIPFKHIETKSKARGNYSMMNDVLFKNENAIFLLKRGSVLYPKDSFKIEELENSNFKNIGYNYYQKINFKENEI